MADLTRFQCYIRTAGKNVHELTISRTVTSEWKKFALVATQVYVPVSLSCKLLMVRDPPWIRVLPAGSWPPSFLQLITGGGSPSALQGSVTSLPGERKARPLGFAVNLGRRTTTRRTSAVWIPRRLEASHTNVPPSPFTVDRIVTLPCVTRTLPRGRSRCARRQVTIGEGWPIT